MRASVGREVVDVCLLLEGTYPFTRGGVSSWVHGLIANMPEVSFGLLYIGAHYQDRKLQYELPKNVRWLQEWAVYDFVHARRPGPPPSASRREEALAASARACLEIHDGEWRSFDALFDVLAGSDASIADMAHGQDAWRLLRGVYEERARDISFLDFFWTWRFAFLPVLNLFFADVPPARLYHAVCTGWAGVLGAIAKRRTGAPLVLTEHGIYLNERRIEISQSEWIRSEEEDALAVRRDLGYFKTLWIRLFEQMANLCYERCDRIYTLYDGNRRMQEGFGAPAGRIEVIPNGVDVAGLESRPARARAPAGRSRIGFVGRVVPIKDVKTLLRACRRIVDALGSVEVLMMGPTDEDRPYFGECEALCRMLGLEDAVSFLGPVPVPEYYPTLDLQILTSVSEGQPLAILEGYCTGVPVVATRVGACSEMVEGRPGEDRALGPSGLVTRVGSPEETAEAAIRILSDPDLKARMSEAARRRVRMFYDQPALVARYRGIYALGGARGGA